MQLIDHPSRTVQTPTMRSGGYGSIGRSSPKVGHFSVESDFTVATVHPCYSRPLVMLEPLNMSPSSFVHSTAQSTSVCGEVIQHAH